MFNFNFSRKLIISLVYITSSVAVTVANKYIVSITMFNMFFLYLALQSIFITFVLYLIKISKIVEIRNLPLKKFFTWLPCSILLSLMIYTGVKCMEHLSISVFTLFKNFSIIVTAYFENKIYGTKLDVYTGISFALMILSSCGADFSDYNSNIFGYLWSGLNIASTSSYLIHLKYNLDVENVKKHEAVFYTNFLSIPCLLFCSILFDNLDYRFETYTSETTKLLLIIAFSSFTAFFISYSTVWCLKDLSSTSLCMLGAMNKLFVSFSGIIFLGEKNLNILKVISLLIGAASGLIYTKKIEKE